MTGSWLSWGGSSQEVLGIVLTSLFESLRSIFRSIILSKSLQVLNKARKRLVNRPSKIFEDRVTRFSKFLTALREYIKKQFYQGLAKIVKDRWRGKCRLPGLRTCPRDCFACRTWCRAWLEICPGKKRWHSFSKCWYNPVNGQKTRKKKATNNTTFSSFWNFSVSYFLICWGHFSSYWTSKSDSTPKSAPGDKFWGLYTWSVWQKR